MYFQAFPQTFYSLDNRASIQVVRNFLLRTVISDKVKNNYSVYDPYDIRDGETPEILAFQLYGDSNLHWIILQMNEIHDPRFEWPLDTFNLKRFAEGKYNNINAVHHYENTSGETVTPTLEMFSNSEFGFLSVGSVIKNITNNGVGYVTELLGTSKIIVVCTTGGFVVGDTIQLANSTTISVTPYTIRPIAATVVPITNFVYEDRLNETRRRIKILKPRYVEQIVKDFESKLAQVNV